MFGLQKIALVMLLFTAFAGAAGLAYVQWKKSVIETAGTKAPAEAYSERDTFESDPHSVALEELAALRARMETIESGFNSFEELQKRDWNTELQTNPEDFADRATAATERVFHARQQLLQTVFSE